ncbi:hypothetical protein HMPREF0004_1491 [Achromobacter piechaudii ATCC 43553]|uniref:Uncharacterized protein n=1 Tax=Achromobacter piechaudii ATCC 43553 TaxID=742159 RepID=D4X7P4_9BURK|nr:hypothetical protein HMPREF0004_1491 [Achromobacter piechaudii ATCC 43553]
MDGITPAALLDAACGVPGTVDVDAERLQSEMRQARIHAVGRWNC